MVFGRRWASRTGMNWPVPASRPLRVVLLVDMLNVLVKLALVGGRRQGLEALAIAVSQVTAVQPSPNTVRRTVHTGVIRASTLPLPAGQFLTQKRKNRAFFG